MPYHRLSAFACGAVLLFAACAEERHGPATPPIASPPADAERASSAEAPQPEVSTAVVSPAEADAAVEVTVADGAGADEPALDPVSVVGSAMPPELPAVATPSGPLSRIRGFDEPMAVIHDPVADIYIVSNLNSRGPETPGIGYLSRVKPSGEIEVMRWIDGANKRRKLRTPRGLALLGRRLYVADGAVIRVYDARSGIARGQVKIPGATRLDGLSPAPGSALHVADAGFTAEGRPSGSDAVYRVNRAGHASALFRSTVLGHPTSATLVDGTVWITTLSSATLLGLDARGRMVTGPRATHGQLTGLGLIGDDEVVVTSRSGAQVLRGALSGELGHLAEDMDRPGHPGWDAGRRRVLVPGRRSGVVHVVHLPKEEGQ